LYLHSAVVQTRAHALHQKGKREAIKFGTLDSSLALSIAFFVNAAILVLSAAAFHVNGYGEVAEIDQAYQLLTPLLGVGAAATLFAAALLAAGQNSTVTATLAGQIILEGFLNMHIRPWIRRLITRSLAIIPAVIIAILFGSGGLGRLLILSQIVLSLQLPFAVLPLVYFTSSKKYMGVFANKLWLKLVVFLIAAIITSLNVWLVSRTLFGS